MSAAGGDVLAALTAAGWRFRRPVGRVEAHPASQHVYISNVAALDDAALTALAAPFGPLLRITRCVTTRGGEGGAYVAAVLSFASAGGAAAAAAALDGAPPPGAPPGARPLSARFAALEPPQARRRLTQHATAAAAATCPALTSPRSLAQAPPAPAEEPCCAHADAETLGIPGLYLIKDFVSEAEEAELLAHVDRAGAPWQRLAKRRVQHEGHAFSYEARRRAMAMLCCVARERARTRVHAF